MLGIGDSLLRGMEPGICRADNQSRKVCYLLQAKSKDVAEKLIKMIKPTDYYPFILFHMGMKNMTNPENNIKRL